MVKNQGCIQWQLSGCRRWIRLEVPVKCHHGKSPQWETPTRCFRLLAHFTGRPNAAAGHIPELYCLVADRDWFDLAGYPFSRSPVSTANTVEPELELQLR